jgi:hypothetical protein
LRVLGLAACAWVVVSALDTGRPAAAQEPALRDEFEKPKRHFKVDRPAELSDAAALTVYMRMIDEMTAGYRLSGDSSAGAYRTWRRYNKTPYRSATHGQRFVNNYANNLAKAYGRYENAGDLPEGAVLAKDSFAVTSRGDVFSGPLFLMEKMPAGFDPKGRDWRYTMIMPDGSLFGRTKGEGSGRVEFCATCHETAGAENDHLFFLPKEQRVRIFSLQPQDE